MTNRKITIFDTTLRDGEQAPGCTLTADQKVVLAGQLVRLGVDVIEPGFPISSPGDYEAVQRISRMYPQVEIVGFARAVKEDIGAAVRATEDAASRRLHLFLSSSDIHLNYQLRKNRAEVIQIAREMVAYAKQFVDRIEYTAMDASRTGTDFLIEMVEAVIAEGATMINLPDTVGYALPDDYGQMFRTVRKGARGAEHVAFSAHCHNDLGMAVANSVAAIQAGASQVEVTVNGIGERTGNCALEELVMVLETHKELGIDTNIKLSEIYETSRMVSRAMNCPIAYNKPVVGRNAFQHESGIHQDGLLKNRSTYEIMEPEALGISRSMIVLGKHSGRHAIKHRADHFGIVLNEQELESVYTAFKQVADELKLVTDYQLLEIIGSARNEVVETYSLIDLQVTAGTMEEYAATATIFNHRQGVELFCSGVGEGPLGAVISSMKQAVATDVVFEDLELHSLASGESAHGEAAVTINRNGTSYRGTAMHKDIVLAAAHAFLAACNQAVRE
jgi:2-isopropylmalate synthase